MKAGWYNGTFHVTTLSFQYCNLERIQSDAFSSGAFTKLSNLWIYNNSASLFLESNSFGRLLNLKFFTVDSIVFGSEFEWGDNVDLHSMSIRTGLTANVSLEFLLKKIKPPNIKCLSISGPLMCCSQSYTLAASNFTNWNNIRLNTLNLINGRMAIILNQTFDIIGKHLKVLCLMGNQIKHVNLKQFESFIVGRKMNIILDLSDNPIECDCNFYLLKSIWYINFRSRSLRQEDEVNCLDDKTATNWTLNCSGMQTIRAMKIHADAEFLGIDVLVYSKFVLKHDRRSNDIVIQSDVMSSVKILMVHYHSRVWSRGFKAKCQDKVWIHENAKCGLLKGNVQHFQDVFYRRFEFTFVVVIHLTYLRVWPLHLMTIRTDQHKTSITDPAASQYDIPTVCGICLGGLLIGFIGVLCLMKLKM